MIVVTSAGRTLQLRFMHSSHNGVTRPGAGAFRRGLDENARNSNRRVTLCEIAEVQERTEADGVSDYYNVLGQGMAVCHPNDQFRKSTGRKVALTAALTAAGVDTTERESVWDAYKALFIDRDVLKLDAKFQPRIQN